MDNLNAMADLSMVSDEGSFVLDSRSTSPIKNGLGKMLSVTMQAFTDSNTIKAKDLLGFLRQFEELNNADLLCESSESMIAAFAQSNPNIEFTPDLLVDMIRKFPKVRAQMKAALEPLSSRMTIDNIRSEIYEHSRMMSAPTHSILDERDTTIGAKSMLWPSFFNQTSAPVSVAPTPSPKPVPPERRRRISAQKLRDMHKQRQNVDFEQVNATTETPTTTSSSKNNRHVQAQSEYFTPGSENATGPIGHTPYRPSYTDFVEDPFKATDSAPRDNHRGRAMMYSPSHITHFSNHSIDISHIIAQNSAVVEDDDSPFLNDLSLTHHQNNQQQENEHVATGTAESTHTTNKLTANIAELEETLRDRNRQVSSLEAALRREEREHHERVSELTRELEDVRGQLSSRKREIQTLNVTLQQSKREVEELERITQSMREEMTLLKSNCSKMSSEIEEKNAQIDLLKQAQSESEVESDKLEANIKLLQQEITLLQDHIQSLERNEQMLQQRLNDMDHINLEMEYVKNENGELKDLVEFLRMELEARERKGYGAGALGDELATHSVADKVTQTLTETPSPQVMDGQVNVVIESSPTIAPSTAERPKVGGPYAITKKALSEETLVDKLEGNDETEGGDVYTWDQEEESDFIGTLKTRKDRLSTPTTVKQFFKSDSMLTPTQTISQTTSTPSKPIVERKSLTSTFLSLTLIITWTLLMFWIGVVAFASIRQYISTSSEFAELYGGPQVVVEWGSVKTVMGWLESVIGPELKAFEVPV